MSDGLNIQEGSPVTNAGEYMRLIAVVPGFGGKREEWQPLLDRFSSEPGFDAAHAHWIFFDHRTCYISPGELADIGRELSATIAAEMMRSGPYNEVILIGHSMGGLVARHAYLVAAGAVPGEVSSDWANAVKRIVLFASINRGIVLQRFPWWLRLLAYLDRRFPVIGRLRVRDTYRGSTFLTNLRINWIRHFGQRRAASTRGTTPKPPTVVQVLGTDDGVVDRDDSRDLLAFPEGHTLEVPSADHKAIHRLDLAKDPDLRYSVLRNALIAPFPERADAQAVTNQVERIIILLHGIRASNVDDWIRGLKDRINTRDPSRLLADSPTYGYFTAARFALPSVRRKNIRLFQDLYTELLAKYPTAEFSAIAHSNGTYILGHSLLATPGMKFRNVALAGSVLPQDFWLRFENLNLQVGRIRNDRANRDWPVALLCSGLSSIRMRDVGVAGFAGFLGNDVTEVAYYSGGHGAALSDERLDKLVDFALDGPLQPPDDLLEGPGYFRQLSNAMTYLTPAVLIGLVALVLYFTFAAPLGQTHWYVLGWSLLGAFAAYILLDIG